MVFKKIIVSHLLFVALLSLGSFAGDIEGKNLDGDLVEVQKKRTRIVRRPPAKHACMECRKLKTRCEKLPRDQKCKKCKKNRKKCIFEKTSKSNGSPEMMSVEINPSEAAQPETKNSYLQPYPAAWLDESIYFPNLNGYFSSDEY